MALGVREVLAIDQETSRPELWWRGSTAFVPSAGPQVPSAVTGLAYESGPDQRLTVTDPVSGKVERI